MLRPRVVAGSRWRRLCIRCRVIYGDTVIRVTGHTVRRRWEKEIPVVNNTVSVYIYDTPIQHTAHNTHTHSTYSELALLLLEYTAHNIHHTSTHLYD